MKKKIISFLIVLVFCLSFVFYLPFNYVLASEVTLEFPESWYANGVDDSLYISYLASLKTNPDFLQYTSGLVALNTSSNGDITVCIVEPLQEYSYEYSLFGTYQKWVMGYYSSFTTTFANLSSVSFSRTLQDVPLSSSSNDNNAIGFSYNGSMGSSSYSLFFGNAYYYQGVPRISGRTTSAVFKFDNRYVYPSSSLYGLDLSINDTSFYDWIIENNKLSELPSYITTSKLLSFIQFYSRYGGSFTNFVKNIPDWFSHMNIINQNKENVNILKSSMDRLYQEYVNSFWVEVGKGSAENLPHHRRNIQTQTTDDDTTLITDDQNDTLIESILRDILRGVIQIGNQIGDGVTSIINKLSELNFTTTIVNNGGNNDTDTDVEGIDSDISDTMADSIEDVPTLDTEVPNLLSAPAVVGSTVNIYLNVFQSMGLDKILIFAVTVSFLIIKIRGNTK